jgi:RhtB (resistance to homoserine/threonine) family protein
MRFVCDIFGIRNLSFNPKTTLMDIILGMFTVGSVALLGAMSPGPDFAIVSKNTLCHGRRAGIYTALGVGCGFFVHIAYTLFGIGLIIAQSILLFSAMKYIGALYLLYLGIQLLKTKKNTLRESEEDFSKTKRIKNREAFHQGILANVLNPKVTLFFLSVFTQVIEPSTNIFIQLGYGVETAIIVTGWFSLIVFTLSHKHIQGIFNKWKWYIEKILGSVLVALGVKLVFSTRE